MGKSPGGPRGETTQKLEIDDPELLLRLSGPHAALLREVALHTGVNVSLRGNTIVMSGEAHGVEVAHRFLEGAAKLTEERIDVRVADVAHSIRGLRKNANSSLVDLLDQVILITPRRKPIAPKTAAQRAYIAAIRSHTLTFGIGPAGTGKTYLAMAMAATALVQRRVKRIILTRPAVEAGERLGFLPGDLSEKVNPYLRPLYDALNEMLEVEKIQTMRARGEIEVAPLAFMRGRTLNDAFIILDEAQNATPDQMKMFLTRLGHGSTAVVTGDVTQVDLPRGTRSGLKQAREILMGVPGIAFNEFTDVDVVRHPLVQRIVVAYDKFDQAQEERRRTGDWTRGDGPRSEVPPKAPRSEIEASAVHESASLANGTPNGANGGTHG